MKLASYRWISCSNIRRKKRERSTPNGAISRLYTSSKQMKLASYRGLPYVRLSACEKRRKLYEAQISKRTRKSLTSKNEFKSCNEQSYVRTQLAIARAKKLKKERSTPNGVISRLYTSTKEMNECRTSDLPTRRLEYTH